MEYYAHVDRDTGVKELLRDHLSRVARQAEQRISPAVRFGDVGAEMLRRLAYWIAAFHDVGKYTDFFQKYLTEGINHPLKSHAHISACWLYGYLIGKRWDTDEHLQQALAFLAYLVVRHHHGDMAVESGFLDDRAVREELLKQSEHLQKKLEEFIQDMSQTISDIDRERFFVSGNVGRLLQDKRFLLMPSRLRGKLKGDRWYFLLIYIFSLLVDLDKLSSADIETNDVQTGSPLWVSQFLERKQYGGKGELDERRDQARRTMIRILHQLDDERFHQERFFTITAPTGLGKTLAALQVALEMQKRMRELEGYTPRIITAIPFINIIEQTRDVYEGVLSDLTLLTHHRFTDFAENTENGKIRSEEQPLYRKLMQIESWEGDVVLTTFVQLWQSLLTGKNRLLKKVNKLAGSIVILDEVQSLPEKYLPLIGALIRKLGEYFGTRFILMTATQPKILELGDQLLERSHRPAIELLPDNRNYFSQLRRTKFVPYIKESFTTDTFCRWVLERWYQRESALVVVNTIKRSIELYGKMKQLQEDGVIGHDVHLHYLSTNIIPRKRKEVIDFIKEKLKDGRPVLLISTQTIEAGVDLDFHVGFRDLAPLDSLIQTAGRINREGRYGEYRPVYIVQLEKDHQWIYRFHNLDLTRKLLEKDEIFEPDYVSLMEKYFEELKKLGISDDSRELWEDGILRLDFDKLAEFKLIENLGQVVDVYVELAGDPMASRLADAYEAIVGGIGKVDAVYELLGKECNLQNPFIRRSVIRLVLARMSEYMVQVRINRAFKNRPNSFSARNGVEAPFYWIPPDQIEQYYDFETGFKDESGEAFIY